MILPDLDPDALGADAAARVLRRLSRLVAPLSPLALHTRGEAAESGLAWTVAQLTRWAQSGALGDWEDHRDAADALLTVGEALWSRPVDEEDASHGWSVADLRAALAGDDEPSDPLRLAVGAAVARWLVCEGEPVTTGELAALAGISGDGVRQAIKREQLAATTERDGRTSRSLIAAEEARRWLAARGAPGWR